MSNNTNKELKLGNIYGDFDGGNYAGNVYDKDYISPALLTMSGGNRQPMIVDVICIAERGRNNNDNKKWEQQYEPNLNRITNTLTSATKDNLILEINKLKE